MAVTRLIACLSVLASANWSRAQDRPVDGLYAMSWDGTDGRLVDRADTDGQFRIGNQLATRFGEATVRSLKNDNSLFQLMLVAGPVPKEAAEQRLAIVVAGYCIPASSNGERRADGMMPLQAQVAGEEAARQIGAELEVKPNVRVHPGHRLLVGIKPEKPSYAPREPVTLVMTIRNVGDVPIQFYDGGSQRGPRNNQFGFTAFRTHGFGTPLCDIGDPNNFGGLLAHVRLAPGETFTKPVTVTDWFTFDAPDTYGVTAMFDLALCRETFDAGTLWDDVAVARCEVRVVQPPIDAPATRPAKGP